MNKIVQHVSIQRTFFDFDLFCIAIKPIRRLSDQGSKVLFFLPTSLKLAVAFCTSVM